MKYLVVFSFLIISFFTSCDFQNATEVNNNPNNQRISKAINWQLLWYDAEFERGTHAWVSYSESHDPTITSYKLRFDLCGVVDPQVPFEPGEDTKILIQITNDEGQFILNKTYYAGDLIGYTYIENLPNTGSRNDIYIEVTQNYVYPLASVVIYRANN